MSDPGRAWDAATLWSRSGWRVRLPGAVIDEVLNWFSRQPAGEDFLEYFEFEPTGHPALTRFGGRLRERLFELEGVCWIQGLGEWRLSCCPPLDLRLLF